MQTSLRALFDGGCGQGEVAGNRCKYRDLYWGWQFRLLAKAEDSCCVAMLLLHKVEMDCLLAWCLLCGQVRTNARIKASMPRRTHNRMGTHDQHRAARGRDAARARARSSGGKVRARRVKDEV